MSAKCLGIFAKLILIVSNIIYMLVAVGMVGFGLFFLVHHADIELVFGSETIGWFVGFLVVGMAIFIIAVIGIFGAVLGKHKLLIVYMIATLALCLLLMAVTVLSVLSVERNSKRVQDQFMRLMENYEDDSEASQSVDTVQDVLECCGLIGPNDWSKLNVSVIPKSCECEADGANDTESSCTVLGMYPSQSNWKQGCNETLDEIVQIHLEGLAAFSFFFATAEFVTVLVALALCICILRIRKHDRRIANLQSVAYSPLDNYPASTITNHYTTEDDEELLKGEITIQ